MDAPVGYTGTFDEIKGNVEPLVDLASCRYCNICGVTIFPDKIEQHSNYHLTVQNILTELTRLATGEGARVSNIWLDLDNLKNGELT